MQNETPHQLVNKPAGISKVVSDNNLQTEAAYIN